ncbi:MAG TPA: PrsW family glutamic-type intramembrane protease, partial [Terricaulis sp.]|nr:PrsW family glutamic-type intramembrane protease [Terricaulis sp.]
MSDHNPHHMQTPTPRDHNVASNSEIMPFSSSKIKLWKSPLFIVAVLVALATPFLFVVGGNAAGAEDPRVRMAALIVSGIVGVFVLLMMIQLAAFLYAKPGRSFLIYMIPFAVVVAILFTPLSMPFFFIFREILPGNVDMSNPQQLTLMKVFVGMLFGAGMMEELLKATPILIGAYLTHMAIKQPSFVSNVAYKLLHVRGPLDGVLMGIFAGGGFIFFETAFDYIPRISSQVFQQTNDIGVAVSTGLSLLLPRVLGGLVGHMAYSGIFGYFIGLSVIRPQQRWQLLGIGFAASTLVHTAWNTAAFASPMLLYVVAVICAVALVGCVLKARQIDASRSGGPVDTQGSILVDRVTPAAAYPAPQPQAY